MKYSYEILSVDESAKMMEVKFFSENETDVIVSCDIPLAGVDIKAHLNNYAPIQFWELRTAVVQSPVAGSTGDIWSEHPEYTPEELEAQVAPLEAN